MATKTEPKAEENETGETVLTAAEKIEENRRAAHEKAVREAEIRLSQIHDQSYQDRNNQTVITGDNKMPWQRMLLDFLEVFKSLFDPELREYLAVIRDQEDDYVDPTITAIGEDNLINVHSGEKVKIVLAPPVEQKDPSIVEKDLGLTSDKVASTRPKTYSHAETLSLNVPIIGGAYEKLVQLLEHYESKGDDNIVYNYENKHGRGKIGLQPGDKTPGGLVVPDVTKLTLDQVQEWQGKYLEEQYTIGGIARGTGSSALGSRQFTKTRLEDLEKRSPSISGNMIFDEAGQKLLTQASLYDIIDRTLDKARKQDLTQEETIELLGENVANEWEGLRRVPEEQRQQLMRSIVTDKDTMAQLKTAYNDTPPPPGMS